MRVTANELRDVLSRLPAAHKHGPGIINLAICGEILAMSRPGTVPRHSDLRVVTFIKRNGYGHNSGSHWELVLA